MPKMKTKSGAKKRFRVTAKGRVKAKQARMRHMQMNKPKSMKRKARGQAVLAEPNEISVLENWMPYERAKKARRKSNVLAKARMKAAVAAKTAAPKTTKAKKVNTTEKGGA